jgi:hypothetical protein
MSGVPANESKTLIAKSANQQAAVLSGLAAPVVEREVDLVSSSASQNPAKGGAQQGLLHLNHGVLGIPNNSATALEEEHRAMRFDDPSCSLQTCSSLLCFPFGSAQVVAAAV